MKIVFIDMSLLESEDSRALERKKEHKDFSAALFKASCM